MRIAVIAPPWLPVPPPAYGGTEVVLDELCRGLQRAGHDVLLFATGDSTCPVERAWTYDVAPGVALMQPAAELRHVVAAYDAVRAWGADVVHDHTLSGPLYADRFPELAVVTTNHGPFDADLAAVYGASNGRVPLVAISEHQAASAPGLEVAAVIHHGIDPQRYPVGAGTGGYAVFVGRMCADKGVHVAARAARRAGIPLRIAAKMREQAEHTYFEEQVAPLLGDDVQYVGEVGGDEKLRLLGDAFCMVNPIAWPEPFGMVMVEALACGTPVVATPLGAAPEIVDGAVTGYLCRDEDAIVAALGRVTELDRAGCRRSVEDRFSANRMAAEHVALYERVLKERAG